VSSLWPDLVVRTLLDSTIVLAQTLLLNWLGVPFAAITLFAGLAAYSVALALHYGVFAVLPLILLALTLLLVFILLVPHLPDDRYLLLSLSALALARSLAGSLAPLGGQLGISSAASILPSQQPASFLPLVVPLFLLALGGGILLQRSQIGLAVDIARLARSQPLAAALVPLSLLRAALFSFAVLLAMAAGMLEGLYSGRVDPNVFRMDVAITVLVVTLAAGRKPLRVALVTITFFAFPDIFASLFGYQRAAVAHVREIAWSVSILILAGYELGQPRASSRRPAPATSPADSLQREG
jgi:ABC-type branched-subunit amino acid transport system permease subunit